MPFATVLAFGAALAACDSTNPSESHDDTKNNAGESGAPGVGGTGNTSGGGTAGDATGGRGGTAGTGGSRAGSGGDAGDAGAGGEAGFGGEGGDAGDGGEAGESGAGAGGNSGAGAGGGSGAGPGGSSGAGGGAAAGGASGAGAGGSSGAAGANAGAGSGGVAGAAGAGGSVGGGAGASGQGGAAERISTSCSVGISHAEACNGEDDDCDGVVDDGLGTFSCGMGACRVTVQACVNGAVSACVPAAPTTTVDGCNEVDDDCDGAVDEDCSGCLHVAPDGNDTAASVDGVAAFRNVQPAIDFASTHDAAPRRICVASGSACGATATFPGPAAADLRMRSGIDVYGGYESTGWTRCSDSTTRLAPATALGVAFRSDIDEPTTLDGFAIDRFAASMTAGVTVDGARGVLLSNLTIEGGPDVASSYGVNLSGGADATIFRSRIDGGRGTNEGIGVRSVGARVSLEDNCTTAPNGTTGRCEAYLLTGTPPTNFTCASGLIRGRAGNAALGRSEAVHLEDSPGSRIERSAICSDFAGPDGNAGVHVVGRAAGVVIRGNTAGIRDSGVGATHGISAEACGGDSPWIVDNYTITDIGGSTQIADAISVSGDCHPVIDSNQSIGSASWNANSAVAMRCSGGSRCVIVKNTSIGTSTSPTISPFSFSGTGLICDGGSCTRISRNTILGVGSNPYCLSCFISSTGASVAATNALIDRNEIRGGCSTGSASGLFASGNVTIANNVIVGFDGNCGGGYTRNISGQGLGVSGGRVNVHSNYIQGVSTLPSSGWVPSTLSPVCRSNGVTLGQADQAIFRNNRIFSGRCYGLAQDQIARGFVESGVSSDPTVFENNAGDIDDPDFEQFFYFDEGRTGIGPAAVNALTDMTASGNIWGCSSNAEQLVSGSACVNRGTVAGAPLVDIDGQTRDATPDIGPDEL